MLILEFQKTLPGICLDHKVFVHGIESNLIRINL